MPRRNDIHKILIIGSGPIVIGQACEFDYSGTQACKALRECGYEVVLVNSNPATIMTDPGMADATYVEPLDARRLEQIIAKERPDALLPNLGGQTGLNLSMELAKTGVLEKHGVKVIGVNLDAIERGEDREVFKATMAELGIDPVAEAREPAKTGGPLAGAGCVLTGTLSRPRSEYAGLIEKAGGTVQSSVTSRTRYLIAGANVGATKTEKARALGTEVIDEARLLELLSAAE